MQDNFSLAELIDCFEEVSSIPPNLPINKSAIGICVFSRLIQNAFHLESANVHDFLQETLLYDSEPSITSSIIKKGMTQYITDSREKVQTQALWNDI